MRSNRASRSSLVRFNDQRGIGLVEVLVASAILGVALTVMLGNLGTLTVGARVADSRTGEERLVRNQIEALLAQPAPSLCPRPSSTPQTIDDNTGYRINYTVKVVADCTTPHYLQYTVTAVQAGSANDRSGVSLSVGRYQP